MLFALAAVVMDGSLFLLPWLVSDIWPPFAGCEMVLCFVRHKVGWGGIGSVVAYVGAAVGVGNVSWVVPYVGVGSLL